jgi:predicted dienelactone hydrolase
MRRPSLLLSVLVVFVTVHPALAQTNRVDTVTPMAPELAAYGDYAVGVRTLQATDTGRPDIVNTTDGEPVPRADRTLTLEVWYPAVLAERQTPDVAYHTTTRDPAVKTTLHGRAVRDAAPMAGKGNFPLVIVSHGYPGNRYLLSHLTENLASKGFVVVAIDHTDSTYDDQQAFASTLYHRPFDVRFVLDEMARLGRPGSGSFLSDMVDASRTGLVGYSMGGYGVLNVVGAGFSEASVSMQSAPPAGMLAERGAANPDYRKAMDPRVKAAIAIAPWGMTRGVWDAEGLRGIRTPVLFVAGSADEVSGYETGTRAMFEGAVNAERYLLTFANAGHNAGAPIPTPAEAYAYSASLRSFPFLHYADAVWDTVRMNNILAHFATAFFALHLDGDEAGRTYLDVVPQGTDALWAVDKEGQPTTGHTYWKGFKRGTAVGLSLEHASPR